MSSQQMTATPLTHRIYEDFFAIVIGTLMVSFGVILLALLQLYLLGVIWAVLVSTHTTLNIRKTFRKHFG